MQFCQEMRLLEALVLIYNSNNDLHSKNPWQNNL